MKVTIYRTNLRKLFFSTVYFQKCSSYKWTLCCVGSLLADLLYNLCRTPGEEINTLEVFFIGVCKEKTYRALSKLLSKRNLKSWLTNFDAVNSFHATGLFLCPLKTGSLRFSDVFRGYRKRPVAWVELTKSWTRDN